MNIAVQQAPNIQSKLGTALISESLIDENTATQQTTQARDQGRSLYLQLYETGIVDTKELLALSSTVFSIPSLDVGALNKKELRTDLLADKVVKTLNVLPLFKRGPKLFVAVADPENITALDEVKFQTSLDVEPILVDKVSLARLIDEITAKPDENLLVKSLEGKEDFSFEGMEELQIDSEDDDDLDEDIDANVDTPVVRFVNRLMLDAIAKRVSDIHVEAYETKCRIRYRIDGVLHEVATHPQNMHPRVVSRIKILSKLNVAERRAPQDGRIRLKTATKADIDFRVSTLPTLYGEKVVMRVLQTDSSILNLRSLGFTEGQLEHYMSAIERPHGMILVTGPTGSGKTVSLYSALNLLNTPGRNISTIEDPIEINLHGINQTNINEKADLTFATALRSFLRQDPDVIMVGEMRDQETTEIGLSAAQTGHLVLSTLHTNDAPSTLTRLLNMGVESYNVAASVHLIMSQRLARKLCDSCKQHATIPTKALIAAGFSEQDASSFDAYESVGCDACVGGYRGRTGIYEVMPLSDDMQTVIITGGSQIEIEKQARIEGINSLRQSGLEKVKEGITSLNEIERVTTN